MLKKMCVALLGLASMSVSAQELTTYQDIVKAIGEQGLGIRLVMNIKNCQSDYPLDIDAIGSVKPSEVMVIESKYVTFASLHFTTNEPKFKGTPVYESSKYILTPDGQVTIKTDVLNATSFKPLSQQSRVTCTLNQGVHIYSTP